MFTKERYMIDELAKRWGCTKDDVLWEIQQGRLAAIVNENYRPSTNTLHVSNYVMSKEVERYEEKYMGDKQSPASNAAATLKQHRDFELNNYVVNVMNEIKKGVKQVEIDKRPERVINHIRFIKESGVPDKLFNGVKTKVALQIKEHYHYAGFTSLSRAPKKKIEEDYFLIK